MSQIVLFEDKKSFRERNNEASKKSYEKKKNMLLAQDFEHFCVDYLNEKNFLDSKFYHWSNVSHDDLYKCGYIHSFNEHRKRCVNNFENGNSVRDVGIDFIGKNDNNFIAGQSKLYDKHVCLKDVGTWISKSFVIKKKDQNNQALLMTVNGLSSELIDDLKIHEFNHIQIDKREFDEYLKSKKLIVNNHDESIIKLRDYQEITIKNIVNHINSNTLSKNVLNLTCALGKTLIIGWILKLIKPICSILIAPIRSEVDNLYQRIPKIINDTNFTTLLLDSDESANIDLLIIKIKECIKNKQKILIFTTMKTATEKISNYIYSTNSDIDIVNFLKKSFIVFDEIHQLSYTNDLLIKLLNDSQKSIYATATLPYSLNEYCPYNNIIDKYDFRFALENKYVVDYKILIPMKLTKHESLDEVYSLVQENDKNLTQQASSLLTGMLLTGSRRGIVYLSKVEECVKFNQIFEKLCHKYHGKNCEVYRVNGDVSFKEREKVFQAFEEGDDDILKIITTCECLNQAINLVRCDSIFITNITKNTNIIVLFQRFMRGMRVDKKNHNKVNHCFLWSECEINELEECLMKLKMEMKDELFDKKVSMISRTYDSQNIQKVIDIKEEEQKNLETSLIHWKDAGELRELRKEALLYFVQKENMVPKQNKIFVYKENKFNLGQFWNSIKQGQSKDLLESLLENDVLKEDFEKVQKIKLEKKEKGELTPEEKRDGLLQFIQKENRIPKRDEIYVYKEKYFKIGRFWDKIKQGQSKDLLKSLLENDLLKEDYERVQKLKLEKKEKEELTPEEKKDGILQFVQKENRVPKQKDIYVYKEINFRIGSYWAGIKQGSNKDFLKSLLEHDLLKEDYEKVQKIKLEKKEKKELTPEEKRDGILQFVQKENRVPKQKETYVYKEKDFKIGVFWNCIKQGQHKDLLKYLLENDLLKEDYERVQKLKLQKKKE